MCQDGAGTKVIPKAKVLRPGVRGHPGSFQSASRVKDPGGPSQSWTIRHVSVEIRIPRQQKQCTFKFCRQRREFLGQQRKEPEFLADVSPFVPRSLGVGRWRIEINSISCTEEHPTWSLKVRTMNRHVESIQVETENCSIPQERTEASGEGFGTPRPRARKKARKRSEK